MTHVRAALLAVLCAACEPRAVEPVAKVSQGIVVGDNDLTPVADDGANVPAALAPSLDAIGRMQGIACTGVHVGGGLVLTAAHCMMADALDDCASTSIEWGVRGERRGPVGRCRSILFIELSDARDIALFEVDQAPEPFLAVDACRARGPGDRVMLFGHPARAPLHWSGTCMLEAGLGGARTRHVCDTDSGSSGGPLLDAHTLEVVGVHVGGAGAVNQATLTYGVSDLFEQQGWACACEQGETS